MEALTPDCEARMENGRDDHDCATQSQPTTNYKAPRQTVWFIERHNATITTGLQRTEPQMMTKNLVALSNLALALATFTHNALTCINGHAFYQAPFGRQTHISSTLERRYDGDPDAQRQNNIIRAREIATTTITEAIAQTRVARANKHQTAPALERSEHNGGDLIDI